MNTTPTFAYLRTSSATNVEGDSSVRQRKAVMDYADRSGYTVVREFPDDAVSGADIVDLRPGFRAMLAAIETSGVRTVLVESADRFARGLMVQEAGIMMLIARGVRLITANGTDLTDNSDSGKVFVRQVMGGVAQLDKSRIVERLKGARDRASIAAGHRVEGGNGGHPDNPGPVQDIVRHTVAQWSRATLAQIANMVTGAGYRTRTGGVYGVTQIARIVKSCNLGKADMRGRVQNFVDNAAD